MGRIELDKNKGQETKKFDIQGKKEANKEECIVAEGMICIRDIQLGGKQLQTSVEEAVTSTEALTGR